MADDGFAVLFVCHANLCRSPMAERLARRAFAGGFGADAAGLTVASAGTHAYAGSPMHPGTAQVLAELGAQVDGFASRPLTPRLVTGADLVLTATRAQRAACVTMAPDAVGRTFTLRQFGRLAGALDKAPEAQSPHATVTMRLRALVGRALVVRGRLQPVRPTEDELSDPVSQPVPAFRVCAAEIQRVLDVMLGAVIRS
jgi:protein-tyrosine phosphatase